MLQWNGQFPGCLHFIPLYGTSRQPHLPKYSAERRVCRCFGPYSSRKASNLSRGEGGGRGLRESESRYAGHRSAGLQEQRTRIRAPAPYSSGSRSQNNGVGVTHFDAATAKPSHDIGGNVGGDTPTGTLSCQTAPSPSRGMCSRGNEWRQSDMPRADRGVLTPDYTPGAIVACMLTCGLRDAADEPARLRRDGTTTHHVAVSCSWAIWTPLTRY